MPNKSATTPSNKPVKTLRLKGVHVSIFRNESEKDGSVFHKVTAPQKTYKEGSEFKTTSSLGRDDLPVAQHLLNLAWVWILEAEANKGETQE